MRDAMVERFLGTHDDLAPASGGREWASSPAIEPATGEVHGSPGAGATSRRGFLSRLALGAVAATATAITAVATVETAGAAEGRAAARRKRKVKVFRFRTRNTTSCRACQLHHRYTMFLTKKAARRGRAHPGCDCPIVPQWIAKRDYHRLFERTGAVDRGFVDLRAV